MKAKLGKKAGGVVLELNRKDEPMINAAERTRPNSAFLIKRVLVPVDFSECSRKALRYAVPFAEEHEAAITLLYAVAPLYAASEFAVPDYTELQASMSAHGEKELAKLASEEIGGRVPFTLRVRTGQPTGVITETAKELDADLIVISTHGRTGLKHVLLGSVVENVVRRAPCPVLVVREDEHEFLAR
ncbi:MAG: universal stress protein [Verrucomicrobia bacterium]|nr:universal stress protein [Verrucomicrobiota bacterium]